MKRTVLAVALATACASAAAQPADPNSGRNLAAACAMCHGTNGSNAGGLPDLAGQPREHVAQQLRDFRDGKRAATIMHQIAKGYTEPQIDALAAFFAAQKAK
jgi:cytochrome subunit of sulfide dehydrogenase